MLGADQGQSLEGAGLDLAGRSADILQPESDLVEDPGEDDLVLGVLEERGDGSRQAGRPVSPRVQAGDLDAAGEAPAMEVRDESREGAKQCRLPGPGGAEHQGDLSRDQVRGHVAKSHGLGAPVRERHVLGAR